jgi:hypothetical protein
VHATLCLWWQSAAAGCSAVRQPDPCAVHQRDPCAVHQPDPRPLCVGSCWLQRSGCSCLLSTRQLLGTHNDAQAMSIRAGEALGAQAGGVAHDAHLHQCRSRHHWHQHPRVGAPAWSHVAAAAHCAVQLWAVPGRAGGTTPLTWPDSLPLLHTAMGAAYTVWHTGAGWGTGM